MTSSLSDVEEGLGCGAFARHGHGDSGCILASLADANAFYLVSATAPDPGHLGNGSSIAPTICHPLSEHRAPAPTASHDFALLTAGPPYLRIKGEQAWPSPPLGPGDVECNHYPQDSPSSAGGFFLNYSCSPTTSRTWSPIPSALPQPVKNMTYQQDGVSVCGPTSVKPLSVAGSGICSPFPDELQGFPSSSSELCLGLPVTSFESGSLPTEELLVQTPKSMVVPKIESPSTRLGDVPEMGSEGAMRTSAEVAAAPEARLDEPYAKLIYRAFMSRKDHAMTLQGIYQWFRENTSKAVSEKGGWQNSIRHNLSMNAVRAALPFIFSLLIISASSSFLYILLTLFITPFSVCH